MRRHKNSWIVGLDLQPRRDGALEFARWLKRSNDDDAIHLIGIHVLESFYLYSMLHNHNLSDVIRLARETLIQDVQDAGGAGTFAEVRVLQGGSAEQTLHEACAQRRCQGMIVGRHAAREGRNIVRLGRVARRALREVDRPTFIVPPDLTLETVGSGPVVVAVNLDEYSVPAVRFAQGFARQLDRPLLVVHIVPTPERYGSRYMPLGSLDELHIVHEETGQADLEDWANEFGFGREELRVVAGSVVGELLALATETNACTLVAGSRRLAAWERVFVSSVATELAATARCAVAVVPAATRAPVESAYGATQEIYATA